MIDRDDIHAGMPVSDGFGFRFEITHVEDPEDDNSSVTLLPQEPEEITITVGELLAEYNY